MPCRRSAQLSSRDSSGCEARRSNARSCEPRRCSSRLILVLRHGGWKRSFCAASGVLGRLPVIEAVRDASGLVPKHTWPATKHADGGLREHADVIE